MSVVRNTGYNLAASVVPIVLSLVVLPLYVHAIGPARYGMVALVAALVGFFGVFDLGLSAAVTQRIAAARDGDIEIRRQVFWTAACINLVLGVLGGLIILPVAWYYVGDHLKVDADLLPEIRASVWWLALALPVALMTGVLRGALQGSARFAELNLINIVVGSASQLVPLLAAWWISPSLTVVLPVLYLTRLVIMACFAFVIANRVLYSWAPRFDRSRVKDLMAFGGWVTVSGLISPIMQSVDRYLIGSMAGLAAVSHYSVPYQIAERTSIFPSAIVSALFPRIAAARPDEVQVLATRGIRAIAAIMGPPMVAGVVLLHPLLRLWIGDAFADAGVRCGQVLLIGFWWNAVGIGCFGWLYALNRARLVTVVHLIEVVPYLALLVLGLSYLGVVGAALAFSVRVMFDAVLLGRAAGLGRECLRLSIAGLAFFGWAYAVALPSRGFTPASLVAAALPVLVCSLVSLAWLYGERASLLAVVGRRRKAGEA